MFISGLILNAAAMMLAPQRPHPRPGEPMGAVPKRETWTQEWQCGSSPPSSITIGSVQRPPSPAVVTLVSLRIAGKRIADSRLVDFRKLLSEASAPDRISPLCGRTMESISVKIFERPGVPPRREPWKLFFFQYE